MPSHPRHRPEAARPVAPRRHHTSAIEAVLEAVLDGDLLRAVMLAETAGPEAWHDGEALALALLREQTLGLELEDARALARAITADVLSEGNDTRAIARELLSRCVGVLGLTARIRQSDEPVVLDLDSAFLPTTPLLPSAPLQDSVSAGRTVFEGLRSRPSRPVAADTSVPLIPATPAPLRKGPGAPAVRGFYRDIFEQQSWLPRVDMLVVSIAPTVEPGVYALQRRALGGSSDPQGMVAADIRRRLGPGRPLPEGTAQVLAERLAADGLDLELDALRVHDDTAADDLCRELEAEAFAFGSDLVFRQGAFRPEEPAGLELLLHELTHVWQQARGLVAPGVDSDPSLERSAQETAERLVMEPPASEVPIGPPAGPAAVPEPVERAESPLAPAPTVDASLQRCGPKEMARQKNPPRGHDDPDNPDDPPVPDPPVPDPVPPVPDPPVPDPPVPGTEECESCPEPDLAHASFKPMRELPERSPGQGQKHVELNLAGHVIKVEVPEAQAEGEVEVTFKQNPSPFAALVFKKARLRFDASLRVLSGEVSCGVSLGNYVQVDNVALRVFEDGRLGAELRGIQVNVADNVRALVDLVIGPEGVWGMATVTADQVFVSDMVTIKDGLLHVRVETNGSVNAHGAITVQVHGVGEATLEACYVDGKWGGRLTLARREELELMPGVVLEEIELTGCFAPDEWWIYGAIKVRLFDRFRCVADAKYHWKEGEGKWSFEADLEQFESVALLSDVTLEETHVHVLYEEGQWAPATFHAELHHPWVAGLVDGTWNIEENLWSGLGRVELARQLPMGDSGITLDQAEVTAHVVDNEFTEIHGKVAATFPFQGQPTFALTCLDAVYKVKEEELWATADLRSIRDIQFGRDGGFHAIVHEGAGATAIVEKSALVRTLGGVAFDVRHKDKVLGDGGMHFNWVPGGGVDAAGRFDLHERFGLPDYAAGPLYLLPQPGHFEFLVEQGEPKFIEATGVGFEVAQGEGEEAGLIGGVVSGRFDFETQLGDLSGSARVLRSWREDLGGFGALTVLEGGQLDVEIARSELAKAEGRLDLRLDVNPTENVSAFTLEGHVDGRYNPQSKKVSGKVSAELKTDLHVHIGQDGDEVIIREGSIFETTLAEGELDIFSLKLAVQYWRHGELLLEGECKEAVFDFKTGLLDFFGTLTLKKDIEKRLGETDYSLALVKDVTRLEVDVRRNELVRIGGDIAVELRDGEGALFAGSLRNADYRLQDEVFSGDLELELKRTLGWPRRPEDQAALPPTLRVELLEGSRMSGHIQDNLLRQAEVELTGRVHYQDKAQAEAWLHGRWNLDTDKYDLDGYFLLTDDLVLSPAAAPTEQDIGRWGLVFEKGSQVTVGVVGNALGPVGVDVKMQLRRGKDVCAKGNVTGQYAFGQEGGFTGSVHLEVVKEIGLGRAGRFDMVLGTKTRGDGQLVQNSLTEAALSVELFATEKAQKKAVLDVAVAYTGGSQFSGTANATVLDPIRLGQRQVGRDLYAVELNTRTSASIGLLNNELTAFSGGVGLDILRGRERFAEGEFGVDYDFRNPSAGVTAEGAIRILSRLSLGKVGRYTFVLEGGSSLMARIDNSGLAWIDGQLALGLEAEKDGHFATLTLGGRYVGGDKPDFNGEASATVHKEHDLGFTAYNYGFFLQQKSGFSIKVAHSELTEMHGQIGLSARQRSKKKGGMNGNVSAVLHGDAFKKGDRWEFNGRATANVEGNIQVGTAGAYAFWIEGGTGIDIQVAKNRFVSVEGTLLGKVAEKGRDFLGFSCWVRYEAAENDNDPGFVDARGSARLLGEKELYRQGGFAFSLMPTSGYTALIVVEKNEVKEVSGQLAFRLENTLAKPQPLRVAGFAEGHYDNTRGVFSGRGDIRLESDLEFAMGKNKIVLEKGSGGMTEIQNNELQRLGGTLIGRFDDEQGKLVQIRASGEFNAQTPELERLEGSAVLLRQLALGPAANPWIVVDKGLTVEAKMAHNKLTYAKGNNGRFRVPALRIAGGFDYLTMDATGARTTYAGKGFLEMEMLKEDKEKGRKLKGRLDLEYRADDTWNARGLVDYNITPYLGGQLSAAVDQDLDPVLGGTLVMKKKEMLPARDLFEMKFPIIPDTSIPVAGIAGFGFGARAYFGLSSLPMTLSASVGVQNFRPRQMNVPDFQADAEIDWGLRLKAGAMAYLDARLSILVASASIGIQGTAELAGDAAVKAKGKIAGSQGRYWGELGVGLTFAPSVTLKAQPYAKASLFSYEWEKTWDAYTYDLGEVFKYQWGSTYKFGDQPEPPKANSERQDAAMSGAPRQDTTRVNTRAEADAFGQERAAPAQAASQGRPGIESGDELKKKKEKEDADMEGLEKDGKQAADLGSVMAAVGNIITQLGHIFGSLMFGPVGLVLCLAWKWMSGALSKLYQDWCTVRDYVWNNWDKIKEYLPTWFVSFIDFMKSPASAAEKWWNADEYARKAVHAGEHLKAPAEVRGNLAANLFGGWAGDGDRSAIEDIFEFSLNKGDLRAVLVASEYEANDFASAWYRRREWGGSRLKRIFDAAGLDCDPGVMSGLFDDDETSAMPTDDGDAQAIAGQGLQGGGGHLPFMHEIQKAFGDHDLSGVKAHTDHGANEAARALGAHAYASGEAVAFAGAPDLHTAAHEAAHVIQQRRGVAVDGIGRTGDALEQHADLVADKVVAGESAVELLDAVGSEGALEAVGLQYKKDGEEDENRTGSPVESEVEKPPTVEITVAVKSQETPGVTPPSPRAFGQVMPYQSVHISKIETKGDLTRVHLVHFTDFRWGVQSLGNEDATIGAVSLEPAARGRLQGLPKWKQMYADMLPMPGTNAPRQEAFWSREHTEAHERFHIADLRGWMIESAPTMAKSVFDAAVFTSAELEAEVERAADKVQSVVFMGAFTYLVADKTADEQYYERPGEVRAYAAGAPGLKALAEAIKERGLALEEAKKKGDDGKGGSTPLLGTAHLAKVGPDLEEQHPIKPTGGPEHGRAGGDDKPLWPRVKVELVVREAQDAKLEDNVFGSVIPEFEFEVTDAQAVGGDAVIEGVFALTLHWGVQSLGRKEASAALASAEPETAPGFQGMGLKVYEAMFLDLIPNDVGFPAQSYYWSRALAEMHEKVHLEDFRVWAEDGGKRVAEDSWMMREYTAADLKSQVEAQRQETEVQLQLDSVRTLKGGFPPPPYFQQPTEMHAFGTVAPHLRALAKEIRDAGAEAEKKAGGKGVGGAGDGVGLIAEDVRHEEPGKVDPTGLDREVVIATATTVSFADTVNATGDRLIQKTLVSGESFAETLGPVSASVRVDTHSAWEVIFDQRHNLILIEHGASGRVALSATSERNLIIVGNAARSSAHIDGDENVSVQSLSNKNLAVDLGGYRAFSVTVGDSLPVEAQRDQNEVAEEEAGELVFDVAPTSPITKGLMGEHDAVEYARLSGPTAESRTVHFKPGRLAVVNKIERGSVELKDKTAGAVEQSFQIVATSFRWDQGVPVVDATMAVTHHWDVQANGRKQQQLILATTDKDDDLVNLPVWAAMALSVRPDASNHNVLLFTPWWDEFEAIAHERVHIDDEIRWGASEGLSVLADAWSLASFDVREGSKTSDESVADRIEQARPRVEWFYQRASNRYYLGSDSDPGYQFRAGEKRAHNERAPYLNAIADRIEAYADALIKAENAQKKGMAGASALFPSDAEPDRGPMALSDTTQVDAGWIEPEKGAPEYVWHFGTSPIPGDVAKQFYAHGGFMGAAPLLISNLKWAKILRALMPDVAKAIEEVVATPAGRRNVAPLIPMMENNPVMAAYGMWQSREIDQLRSEKKQSDDLVSRIQAFEWDVFVPTPAVDYLHIIESRLAAAEKKLAALGQEQSPARAKLEQEISQVEAEFYYLGRKLMAEMLIAHGQGTDLLQEKVGLAKYSKVRQDRKVDYGGVIPMHWMDIFGRALLMAAADEEFETLYARHLFEQQQMYELEPALKRDEAGRATFLDNLSVPSVVSLYKTLFKKEQFSVVLDIKTAELTARGIREMIRALNFYGVHVLGVGSFVPAQLEGLEDSPQMVGGPEHLDGPMAIRFFHFPNEFLVAARDGKFKRGAKAMFNASDLVIRQKPDVDTPAFVPNQKLVGAVAEAVLQSGVMLGLYVQEDDIQPEAVAVIDQLVRTHPDTFALGFAWGGMANTASIIADQPRKAQTGLGGQKKLRVLDHFASARLFVQLDSKDASRRFDPAVAQGGIATGGTPLPHAETIQAAFGHHDVTGVRAHTDGAAREASDTLGANAYASGEHVAFGRTPDLHTAAHEAAHVVQQRAGVSLPGGVGRVGDTHERHADAVADAVVRGESAEAMLDAHVGGASSKASGGTVQLDEKKPEVLEKERVEALEPGPLGLRTEVATSGALEEALAEIEKKLVPLTRRLQTVHGLNGSPRETLDKLISNFEILKKAILAEHTLVKAREAMATLDADKMPIPDPAKVAAEDVALETASETRRKAEDALIPLLEEAPQILEAYEAGVLAVKTFLEGLREIRLPWFGPRFANTRTRVGVVIAMGMGALTYTDKDIERHFNMVVPLDPPTMTRFKADLTKFVYGRLQGLLPTTEALIVGARGELLTDIVSLHPELRELAIQLAKAEANGSGSQDAFLEQAGPSADLLLALRAETDDGKRLEAVKTWVSTWGKTPAALADARQNGPLQECLGLMKGVKGAIAQEMLLSGRVLGFEDDPIHIDGVDAVNPDVMKERVDDGSATRMVTLADKDMGLALELVCLADPEKDASWLKTNQGLTLARIIGFKRDELAPHFEKAEVSPLPAEVQKKLDAFVARVGTSQRVLAFLAEHERSFLDETFLPILGYHSQSRAAAIATETKDKKPWHEARELDVAQDQTDGGDAEKKRTLEESHDDLMKGSLELQGGTDLDLMMSNNAITGVQLLDVAVPDRDKLVQYVGDPPDKTRVHYLLDRFLEATGEVYWRSPHFFRLSDRIKAEVRFVLGYGTVDDLPYVPMLDELWVTLDELSELGLTETPAIARLLTKAHAQSQAIFAEVGKLGPDITHHMALAPTGRVPTNTRQVILRAFEALKDVDLVIHLRTLINRWENDGDAHHVNTNFLSPQGAFALALHEVLGVELEQLAGKGERGADLVMDEAALNTLFGREPGDTPIVTAGMAVPPGFTDLVAMQAADNVYAILNADKRTAGFLSKPHQQGAENQSRAAIFDALVLGGKLGALMAMMAWDSRIDTVLMSLKSMSSDTRDAIDMAFRMRFGRTLLSECAKLQKAQAVAFAMGRDSADKDTGVLSRLETLATHGDADGLLDVAPTLSKSAREKLLGHGPLMSLIKKTMGKRMDEFQKLLMGEVEPGAMLAELMAHRDGVAKNDDVPGVDKDVARVVQMVTRGLLERYPDALDATRPNHQGHSVAFKAELRQALAKVAVDPQVLVTAKGTGWFTFMSAEQIQRLQALILGQNKVGKLDALLIKMRDRGYFGAFQAAAFQAELDTLTAPERLVVARDAELRATIAAELTGTDLQLCLSILEGDPLLAIERLQAQSSLRSAIFGKSGKALVTAIEALDFESWTRLREDDLLRDELLRSLELGDIEKLYKSLQLEPKTGRPLPGVKPLGHDALAINRAKAEFHFRSLKKKLLDACESGPGKVLEVATAIYTMTVPVTSDTPETDKLRARAGDDLLSFQEVEGTPQGQEVNPVLMSVRKRLTLDPEIDKAIAQAFGKLEPHYGHVVDMAIEKTLDPSRHLFAYYAGDHELEAKPEDGDGLALTRALQSLSIDAEGLKRAIGLAGPEVFLREFTDLLEVAPALAEYQAEKALAHNDDKKKVEVAMRREQLRRRRVGMSAWARAAIAKVTVTAEKKALDEAIAARLQALMGSGLLTEAKHMAAVIKVLSDHKVDQATLSEIFGHNLDARVMLEKMAKSQHTHNDSELIADHAATGAFVINSDIAETGGATKEGNAEAMKSVAATTEEDKKLEAARAQLRSWAASGASLIASQVVNLVVPGSGWFFLLVKETGLIIAKQGLTANLAEEGMDGFLKRVAGAGLTRVFEVIIQDKLKLALLDLAPVFEGGKLVSDVTLFPYNDFIDEQLKKKVDGALDSAFGGMAKELANLQNWRQLYQRGASVMMKDLVDELGKLDVYQLGQKGVEGAGDLIIGALHKELDDLIKSMSASAMEDLFGKDTKADTSKAFDEQIMNKEGLELWAGGEGVIKLVELAVIEARAAGLGEALSGLPASIGGDVTEMKTYYKAWAKYAIDGGLGLAAKVIKDLGDIIHDPEDYFAKSSDKALQTLGATFDVKALPASAWKWILERAVASGGKVKEALLGAWARYKTAKELVGADEDDAKISADLFDTQDPARPYLVKAFLTSRGQEGYKDLSYARFLDQVVTLETELMTGVPPKFCRVAEVTLAKKLASEGLGSLEGGAFYEDKNEGHTARKKKALKQAILDAVAKAEKTEKKTDS